MYVDATKQFPQIMNLPNSHDSESDRFGDFQEFCMSISLLGSDEVTGQELNRPSKWGHAPAFKAKGPKATLKMAN